MFAGCDNGTTTEYVDRVYNPYADLTWKGALPEDSGEAIGTAKYNIGGQGRVRYEETALGNLVADGMAVSARNISGQTIDFAFINGQNFQSQTTILKGKIYQSSLNSGLTDVLHVATFTAKDIFGIFNTLISSDAYESSGSGWKRNCVVVVSKEVSYTINNSTTPPSVSEIKVNGVAINKDDAATKFRVTTGNFFTTGTFVTQSSIKPYANADDEKDPDNVYNCEDTVKTAVLKYIYAKGTIEPAVEGRIVGTVPVNAN
ncbi:MAG: 5'-nucleotidase C-terminal domain-containing protein [Treponema sp.]|nr:5'-nucleotidase C-terminal domain-containing protein [Treponema sp.]